MDPQHIGSRRLESLVSYRSVKKVRLRQFCEFRLVAEQVPHKDLRLRGGVLPRFLGLGEPITRPINYLASYPKERA